MLTFAKAAFARSFVGKLASSNDRKTTVLGFAAAALMACELDWDKLLQLDPGECGKAVAVTLAAVCAYYTNKADKQK